MTQARAELKPYQVLISPPISPQLTGDPIQDAKRKIAYENDKLYYDAMMETLAEWIRGEHVEIYYDLNDALDYAVHYQTSDKVCVARISECVTINGVRWHLQPGKNYIPKAVYEFLIQCPEQRKFVSAPKPGEFRNIMPGRAFSR
ncbi:MAG: hypothetical protein K2X01_11960 [Cyanobacteria bacterium]|nr:hypothetical protein [Cyanobacteriota bacterium]